MFFIGKKKAGFWICRAIALTTFAGGSPAYKPATEHEPNTAPSSTRTTLVEKDQPAAPGRRNAGGQP